MLPLLQAATAGGQAATASTAIGQPNSVAMAFFFVFIASTLGITYWAAKRTRTTEDFYAAGRTVTAGQNGFALAGDYMSAASFLGIAGLVSTSGFDGLIYSTGWLVGWPVVLFLIAEPLRNLGRYTFADVVALRMRQTPVRLAAALGTLSTVSLYLIAQMVGAGGLIKLMFGIPYESAVLIVGVAMLVYVLFGGMIATTWVQIVKAALLMSGAMLLAVLVLARFQFNPLHLFAAAAAKYGDAVLVPGKLVSNPFDTISLGMALMFGTAGLPHILMRFYTVGDARAARTSVFYATGLIGLFYLMTFILGFGAMVLVGPAAITGVDKGGNMAAPLLAEQLGGTHSSASSRRWRSQRSSPSSPGSRCPAPRRSRTTFGSASCGRAMRRRTSSCAWRGWLRSAWGFSQSCSGSLSRDRTWRSWCRWRSRSRQAAISRRSCSRSSGGDAPRRARWPACWWERS